MLWGTQKKKSEKNVKISEKISKISSKLNLKKNQNIHTCDWLEVKIPYSFRGPRTVPWGTPKSPVSFFFNFFFSF